MSNQLAIAAVTATLRKLIEDAIHLDDGAAKVVTRPPDQVESATNQLNLFLYHSEIDAQLRNQSEWPNRTQPGESAEPPLPLCLYYLLVGHGVSGDQSDLTAHRLLGRAMLTLHDHPLLGADEIKNALPGNDLWEQVERVRITWHPMTWEETSKLWTAFATKFRPCVAYKVAVVLIDSTRPRRTPLPVLTIRTDDGKGLQVQPSLTPPFPTLTDIELPANKTIAELGDTLKLNGHHLSGATVTVQLSNPALSGPIVIPQGDFIAASDTAITIQVPNTGNAPSQFVAGFYAVTVVVTNGPDSRSTNAQTLALAATITSRAPANAAPGNINVTVTCVPQVRLTQKVSLLFGSREVPPQPFVAPANPGDPSTLQFNVIGATAGQQFLRLRVDGVDSNLVRFVGTPPKPEFDPNQMVTVA